MVHSGNIESFRGCTIVDGSIKILQSSFAGFQDFHAKYVMAASDLMK